jgi:hypothetical protein
MGSRKMDVEVKVRLSIRADDDVELGTIIDEMDYNFTDTTTKATIEDTELLDHELIDSR